MLGVDHTPDIISNFILYSGSESDIGQLRTIAQRLEQGTHNPLVVGSNPSSPTVYFLL
jgi:hypothetical protein